MVASTRMMGEVAVPSDASSALSAATTVATVVPARRQKDSAVLALGPMGDWIRRTGGTLKETTAEEAMDELRAAIKSGNTIMIWAVGPPFVALVTATRPELPSELRMSTTARAPVRPGPRRPKIDLRGCDLCGECVNTCPINRLVFTQERVAQKKGCSGCGICEIRCPRAAITMVVPGERS
jgi:Pyruvate/2-oxoacid:ferredoxin oxidoreductase delta subunit